MTLNPARTAGESDATAAVEQLKATDISDSDISIVSNNADGRYNDGDNDATEGAGTGAGIGVAVGGVGGLLTGLGIMAIPGVGPVVAAGWLAATVGGAVAGAVVGGAAGGSVRLRAPASMNATRMSMQKVCAAAERS